MLFVKFDLKGSSNITNPNPSELTTQKDLYFPITEFFIMIICNYGLKNEYISQKAYCIIHFNNISGLQAEMLKFIKESTLKSLTIAETISDKDKKKIYSTKEIIDPVVACLNFQVSSNGNDVMMFCQFTTLENQLTVIDGESQNSQGILAGTATTLPGGPSAN
jgi:hypothetical protein